MSFVPDPELALGSACYLGSDPMFIFAQKVATTKTGTKVQYQVTEQLPDDYTDGGGAYPHPLSWYDRADIQTADEFAITELARLQAEAAVYLRTLTGKPYIWLYGDSTEAFLTDVDSTATYSDAGLYITDIEDGTSNVTITDTTAGPVSDSTSLVVTGDVVDFTVAGDYSREYVATDSCGNESDTVTRTITVYDPPADVPDC
jgi:hypothetical protein